VELESTADSSEVGLYSDDDSGVRVPVGAFAQNAQTRVSLSWSVVKGGGCARAKEVKLLKLGDFRRKVVCEPPPEIQRILLGQRVQFCLELLCQGGVLLLALIHLARKFVRTRQIQFLPPPDPLGVGGRCRTGRGIPVFRESGS